MASGTQWTWFWVNSRSWWWTGRPGMLRCIGSQTADTTERLKWMNDTIPLYTTLYYTTLYHTVAYHAILYDTTLYYPTPHILYCSTLRVHALLLSYVWLFATPWTVTCRGPLSMGFFRQECWSGLPFPPPGDLPNPEIEPASPASLALHLLQADSVPAEPVGKPHSILNILYYTIYKSPLSCPTSHPSSQHSDTMYLGPYPQIQPYLLLPSV